MCNKLKVTAANLSLYNAKIHD